MENKKMSIKEARRVVHNLSAQFQGLVELREALACCVDLEDNIKVLSSDAEKIKKSNAVIFEKLQKAEFKLSHVDRQYEERSKELEAVIQKRINDLLKIEEDEKFKLQRFLSDNQSIINKIKSDTDKAEIALKNHKEVVAKKIEEINNERRKAEDALSQVLKKMESIVGGFTHG